MASPVSLAADGQSGGQIWKTSFKAKTKSGARSAAQAVPDIAIIASADICGLHTESPAQVYGKTPRVLVASATLDTASM
ncbi:MAG: hypothetical protein ACUVWR_19415 [Anaerolineae bacterium]